jgi:thioesterase domain-containing protein/aryl carrier-like protein
MLTVVETDRIAQASFAEIAEEFPCTVSQRKHWAFEQARPGDPTLNIAARWRLEGQVSPTLLGRSLQMLIDRHEPLRTAFVARDHGPVQLVMRTAPTRLRIVDLSHLPEAEREAAATDLAREEARRPFDVNHPPLLRATFVMLDETSADLLVTTHYLVGDCWSNGILAQEMAELYDALHDERTPALPALDLQFGDYANWQEAWLKEGGADKAEAYWERRLAGMPSFLVPTDRTPPAEPGGAGDIFGMPVPATLVVAAQSLARKHGATFFMLGVATMAALLHRWTGATEVTFGTQVAGRDDVELEPLIGPFVNTVVLRVNLAGNPSFAAVLDDVRGIVGEALEHSAAPTARVVQKLGRTGGVAGRRDPLTAVNFLIQRAFTRDADHGQFALKGIPNFSPGSRYDINVFLVERPSGWRASCEYDPELFDRARIDWLLRSFLRMLTLVSSDPACPLSAMSLADLDMPQPASERPAPAPALPQPAAPVTEPTETGVEDRLAALWAKVLGRPSVPSDANFFELGGDSIRAARLLALTKQTIGQTITLGQLFRAPTLAAMSALLRGGADAVPSGVIWVQPKGNRPPIFAINNTGIFYTLSQHLGEDQPFAAVQALDPSVSPSLHPTDFRELAARYAETIRQVRPHGPYALLGLCAAGKVAFEVAQQLQAAGEQVSLLAVVDTWAPGHLYRMTGLQRWLTRLNVRSIRLRRQLQRIGDGTLSIRGFIANRAAVRGLRNAGFERLRRAGVLNSVPPGVQNNLFVNYLDGAAHGYMPRPYAGRVLVFHGPEQPTGRFLDPSFGWNGLVAGRVEVVAVPSDPHVAFADHHQGLFQDPGAQIMAERIAAMLL